MDLPYRLGKEGWKGMRKDAPVYYKRLTEQLKQIVTYGHPSERRAVKVAIAEVYRVFYRRRSTSQKTLQ